MRVCRFKVEHKKGRKTTKEIDQNQATNIERIIDVICVKKKVT